MRATIISFKQQQSDIANRPDEISRQKKQSLLIDGKRVHHDGTEKLLSRLYTHGASGADLILIYVIVEATRQVAPSLKLILMLSYVSGSLPEGWL